MRHRRARAALSTRVRLRHSLSQAAAVLCALIAAGIPAAAHGQCTGDCNGNGAVVIDELVGAVRIALGLAPVSECAAADANGDGQVTIAELIVAVRRALLGCDVEPPPTPGEVLMITGGCRRPGPGPRGLVPCEVETLITAWRCNVTETCIQERIQRFRLGDGDTGNNGNFAFPVDRTQAGQALLLLEAGVSDATLFRSMDLGGVMNALRGRAAGLPDTLDFGILDPSSEAAVRLLDQEGLELYADDVRTLIDAVRAANADTDFTGLGLEDAVALAFAVGVDDPAVQDILTAHRPTPTPTVTVPVLPTPSATSSALPTATPSAASTDTPSPPATATPSLTHTAPPTPTPSVEATAAASPTATRTATPTHTPPPGVPTATPSQTATVTPSSGTPSRTATPSRTGTATRTPSETPTETRTATATRSGTPTRTGTFTRTPSNTPASTSTVTASRSATNTATATRTRTATPTRTPTHTATQTRTITLTHTPTATRTPTASRTVTPTRTSTNTPTPFLAAQLTTNRGCLETGNNPVFTVGEQATIFFRVDGFSGGMTIAEADVEIFDFINGIPVGSFDLGVQPTGQTLGFQVTVTPPTGTETLNLVAEGGQGPLIAEAQCSFQVVSAGCTTACDCDPGQRCNEGVCVMMGNPIYCCTGPCPLGETCQFSNGDFGMCLG
jgi:hypothetical protein